MTEIAPYVLEYELSSHVSTMILPSVLVKLFGGPGIPQGEQHMESMWY